MLLTGTEIEKVFGVSFFLFLCPPKKHIFHIPASKTLISGLFLAFRLNLTPQKTEPLFRNKESDHVTTPCYLNCGFFLNASS